MICKLFPDGKKKAFNVSYDDGVTQDIRFVQLLDRYGLKGTFNLNSGLMMQRFQWVHESGLPVVRLAEPDVRELYQGHEVASHTFSHPYMDHYSKTDILRELGSDRFFLERITGEEIAGYATPFYFYSDLLESCVKECGFAYARISEESNNYSIPEDFYRWKGSKFHWDDDLEDFVRGFLETEQELAICQLVGHSYDLDVMNMWERMKQIFQWVSDSEDVWPATHIDMVRYLKNMDMAIITDIEIRNDSHCALWFAVDGKTICLQPGGKLSFD